MEFICTSRKRSEPGTFPPTGSSDPRKRPHEHYVASRGECWALLYRDSQHSPNDGWKPRHAYQDVTTSRIRLGGEELSEPQAAHDLQSHAGRPIRFCAIHRAAGTDRKKF